MTISSGLWQIGFDIDLLHISNFQLNALKPSHPFIHCPLVIYKQSHYFTILLLHIVTELSMMYCKLYINEISTILCVLSLCQ